MKNKAKSNINSIIIYKQHTSKPQLSRAISVKSHLFAQEGTPLTALYEHINEDAFPSVTQYLNGTKYVSFKSKSLVIALKLTLSDPPQFSRLYTA